MSKKLRIDAMEDASTEAQIETLKQYSSVTIPSDYLELIREGSEIEIAIPDGDYIRIWGAEGCVEMNTAYELSTWLGPSLGIGDDEGGSAIVFVPASSKYEEGLYLVAFNCLDIVEAEYVSRSLRDLLVNEEGIDIFQSGRPG